MNKCTANTYLKRLNNFKKFVLNEYTTISTDNLIKRIKEGTENVYDLLNTYCAHLSSSNISVLTIKQFVVTVKGFLEYHDIEISARKFKIKVKLPKVIRKNKEALPKEDVIDILNACSNIRLKTYIMFLAAGGFRAGEALSIRIKDLDLESKPARVLVRGKYIKTRTDRIVFLTDEVAQQLKSWLDYKYRTRRISYKDDKLLVVPIVCILVFLFSFFAIT
jgi:integrase